MDGQTSKSAVLTVGPRFTGGDHSEKCCARAPAGKTSSSASAPRLRMVLVMRFMCCSFPFSGACLRFVLVGVGLTRLSMLLRDLPLGLLPCEADPTSNLGLVGGGRRGRIILDLIHVEDTRRPGKYSRAGTRDRCSSCQRPIRFHYRRGTIGCPSLPMTCGEGERGGEGKRRRDGCGKTGAIEHRQRRSVQPSPIAECSR